MSRRLASPNDDKVADSLWLYSAAPARSGLFLGEFARPHGNFGVLRVSMRRRCARPRTSVILTEVRRLLSERAGVRPRGPELNRSRHHGRMARRAGHLK